MYDGIQAYGGKVLKYQAIPFVSDFHFKIMLLDNGKEERVRSVLMP